MTASGVVLRGNVVAKINDGALCDWCRNEVHVEQTVVLLCRATNAAFIVVHDYPTDACWHELIDDMFVKTKERWLE